jgi:hypothetical protein
VTLRATFRFLFVVGVIGVITGIYIARTVHVESDTAQFGIMMVIAGGVLTLILGAVGLLREELPADPARARRERILNNAAWKALLPSVVAGGLTVLYFAATGRWNQLDNPIASQVAIFAAVFGVIVGILMDRITRWGLVLVPLVLLAALWIFGPRLPIDGETASRGEMVALLSIVLILILIVVNVPQIVRGRRTTAR